MKLIFLLGAFALFLDNTIAQKRVVCYYGSWSTYRHGNGKFEIENINPKLCTHAIYTFVGLLSDGSIRILDDWNEIGKGGFSRFNDLKKQNPSLKTLVAIGGWNEGSITYSKMVNNVSLRKKFVDNAAAFVLKYGFDGFDLDWEYPNQRGGQLSDKKAFATLLKELREKFDKNKLLLTAAVGAAKSSAELSYDIPELGKYLDFINLMSYDLHGAWDPNTGHNAPLYPGSQDKTEQQRNLNVDACVNYWVQQGAPREKLVVGMGMYGRTFSVRDSSQCKVGASASGPGSAGPYTGEGGMIGYNELCEEKKLWSEKWDDEQKVPYACKGSNWVGYDNVRSIKLKTQYVVDKGLGGAMIWSLETDDFLGKCDGTKFPLLQAINEVLKGNKPDPEPPTQPPQNTPSLPEPTPEPTPPPVDPPPSTNLCQKEGFIRDPNDCSVFYRCTLSAGKLVQHRFTCQPALVFDTVAEVCNWPALVSC